MYHVYVLENPSGKFYIGQTDDLARRLTRHNDPESNSSKFTHKHGPWKLVYKEEYSTRSEAVKREREIKSKKSATWIRDYLIGRASPEGFRD